MYRRVYIKRLDNDITVKAYKHERGFTVGILERQDRPLCKKHVDCANIEDVKQTIGLWEAMK